jgi:hypothetical protein
MPYDVEKINALRKQIYALRKKLSLEYNPAKKRKLQYRIRIAEIQIMIEKTL